MAHSPLGHPVYIFIYLFIYQRSFYFVPYLNNFQTAFSHSHVINYYVCFTDIHSVGSTFIARSQCGCFWNGHKTLSGARAGLPLLPEWMFTPLSPQTNFVKSRTDYGDWNLNGVGRSEERSNVSIKALLNWQQTLLTARSEVIYADYG